MNAQARTASPSAFGAAPERRPVDLAELPGAGHGARYRWSHGLALLGGLLRRHGFSLAGARTYSASFTLDSALREGWYEEFDTRPASAGGADCAFLFAQSVGSLLAMRVFADLGINLRQLRHVRHSVVHPAGQAAYLATTRQRLQTQVLRSVRVGKREVLLVLGTAVTDAEGLLVARVEDSFIVRGLPVADAAQADANGDVRRALAWLGRRSRELDAGEPGSRGRTLYVGPDAARRFARVAGEHSPLHSSHTGARLFGERRPVVPGLYLRNLVARELAEWGLPVLRLTISFAAPVHPGQTLVLVQQGERFELSDEAGRLVAFGRT